MNVRSLAPFPLLLAPLIATFFVAYVGFRYGTYAAGGSDSSCYMLMADAFASGHLQPTSALAARAPWPDAAKTFAPGGFVASQQNPAAASPVCAPGFSVLVAPFMKMGDAAAFAMTPLSGAALVWLAFLVARILAGPVAGAMAAVLVATSPIVLFQVVQPMNDVTTAALWMAVFWSMVDGRWSMGGAFCGLALLVRPNLAPLAAIAGAFVLTFDWRLAPFALRLRRAFVFGVAAAPFVVAILLLNAQLYGGALKTGYGAPQAMFSAAHVAVNAPLYLHWLLQTQTPFVFLAFLAPFQKPKAQSPKPEGDRPIEFLALSWVLVTAAIYFFYTPFDDWSYLRFLMPAIVLLLVLASAVSVRLVREFLPRGVVPVTAVIVLSLSMFYVRTAHDRLAFTMRALEQRYRSVGVVVRERLPENAAVLATWDSGAVRFHARREAIVWDALDPDWLDKTVAWLQQDGHPPYIALESWEEPRFRDRFRGHSPLGNLDWPPRYEVDRVVRIYDPADREKYLRGQPVPTEYLWPMLKGRK